MHSCHYNLDIELEIYVKQVVKTYLSPSFSDSNIKFCQEF